MSELSKERLFELVRNYSHIYDVTPPGHRDREVLKNSWEEIAGDLCVSLKYSEGEVGPCGPGL